MGDTVTVELMVTPEEGRRMAVCEFSARYLLEMLKPGPHCYLVVDGAIPEDAKVVGSEYDVIRDVWKFALFSESFAPVPEYMSLPKLPATVARILDHADQG